MLGILMAPIVFTGFEASATMAEETAEGAENGPTGMIKSMAFSAISSFLLIISMLLACRDEG